MEIQKDVRVGDTATTTPGPIQPFLPVKLLLRHTMVVSPALMFSLGWDLYRTCRISFEQRSLSCCSHFIGSVKICVRICGQQLTINGIITQRASR